MTSKTCRTCGESKPLAEFYRQAHYYRSECRACTLLTRTPATQRRARYGLTVSMYEALARAQFRACAVCKVPLMMLAPQDIHVDHDHSCCPSETSCGSCVRGLLCASCNRGLGQFDDDVRSLESAVRYLRG